MIVPRLGLGALLLLLAACGSDSDSPDVAAGPDGDAVTLPGGTDPSAPANTGTPANDGDTSTADGDGISMPAGGALVTSDTYETLLREIVAIANDETLDAAANRVVPVFDDLAALVQRVSDTGSAEGDGLVFVENVAREDGEPGDEYRFSCENGGTLTVRGYDDSSLGVPFVDRIVADGTCAFGDAVYEGSANKNRRIVRATDVAIFESFSITRADGDSLALDGEYADTTPEARGPIAEKGWSDATLVVVDGGETTRIEGYTSMRRGVAPFATLEEPPSAAADVSFSVTAPWSSNAKLDVVVDLGLVDADLSSDAAFPYPGQWSTGTLRVTAPDGSGLTLSPETGDPATFSVVIDGEGGEPIVRDWADGFQIGCPSPFDCR